MKIKAWHIIVLFLLLIGTIVVLMTMLSTAKRNASIWQHNAKLLSDKAVNIHKDLSRTLYVKHRDLEKITTFYVDSIIKAEQLKSKHILSITTIENEILRTDTLIDTLYLDTLIMGDTSTYYFNHEEPCIDIEGYIKPDDKIIAFTKRHIQDDIVILEFWKREKKKIIFFRIRIGKKQYYRKTYDECNGETSIEKIEIVKDNTIFQNL